MSVPASKTWGEWYFSHTLAGMALFTVIVALGMQVYFDSTGQESIDFPVAVSWTLGICVFGMLWFWIRMISDFFRERPASHPVLWGWVVILGMALGALPYFWLVWRPRHRPS